MLAFRGRPVVATGSAFVGVALIAAVATGALDRRSARTTLSPDEEGSATVRCQRGSEAVSGGFRMSYDPDFVEATNYMIDSRREGKRKVSTSAVNFGNADGDITTFAYCDKDRPHLKTVSTSTALATNEFDSITAKCPRGNEAVSGGSEVPIYEANVGPEIHTIESRRHGRRLWTVSGMNYFGPESGTLTAFAYCDKSEPGLKQKSKDSPPVADGHGIETAVAKCKRGSTAVSGGFESPGFDPTYTSGHAIWPLESRRAGKRKWRVTAENDNDDGPGEFVAYVYCEEKE